MLASNTASYLLQIDKESFTHICSYLSLSDHLNISFVHSFLRRWGVQHAVETIFFTPITLFFLPSFLFPHVRYYKHTRMCKKIGDEFFKTPLDAPPHTTWIIHDKNNDEKNEMSFRLPKNLPPKLLWCVFDEFPSFSLHNYLPPSLQQLSFVYNEHSSNSDKYEDMCDIPFGIEVLEIMQTIKQINPYSLPLSLHTFTIYEVLAPLLPFALPSSLTSFQIFMFFFPLTKEMLPESLLSLSLGKTVPDFSLSNSLFLPSSLTSLYLHSCQQLSVGCLPSTLLFLEIKRYNQPLEVGVLPMHLEELILPSFQLPFVQEALPSKLFTLILADFSWEWQEGATFCYFERYTLMRQLEEAKLHFSSMIDRERSAYIKVQEATVACNLAKKSQKNEKEKLLAAQIDHLTYSRKLLRESDVVVNELKSKLSALK